MQNFLANASILKEHGVEAHLKKLEALFDTMDAHYTEVAAAYGFECDGCTENCCLTRFHHHTVAEYLFLKQGFLRLPEEQRAHIQTQARAVLRETYHLIKRNESVRLMCPLNNRGRCLIYAHRPMICRLHGIAFEMRRPGGATRFGPGCKQFGQVTKGQNYIRFDRTPYYARMAALEKDLRTQIAAARKIKMTIAEMIVTF